MRRKVELTQPISPDEVKMEAVKCSIKWQNDLSNGKASGVDNIPVEVWKSGALDKQLLEVCNRTLIIVEVITGEVISQLLFTSQQLV